MKLIPLIVVLLFANASALPIAFADTSGIQSIRINGMADDRDVTATFNADEGLYYVLSRSEDLSVWTLIELKVPVSPGSSRTLRDLAPPARQAFYSLSTGRIDLPGDLDNDGITDLYEAAVLLNDQNEGRVPTLTPFVFDDVHADPDLNGKSLLEEFNDFVLANIPFAKNGSEPLSLPDNSTPSSMINLDDLIGVEVVNNAASDYTPSTDGFGNIGSFSTIRLSNPTSAGFQYRGTYYYGVGNVIEEVHNAWPFDAAYYVEANGEMRDVVLRDSPPNDMPPNIETYSLKYTVNERGLALLSRASAGEAPDDGGPFVATWPAVFGGNMDVEWPCEEGAPGVFVDANGKVVSSDVFDLLNMEGDAYYLDCDTGVLREVGFAPGIVLSALQYTGYSGAPDNLEVRDELGEQAAFAATWASKFGKFGVGVLPNYGYVDHTGETAQTWPLTKSVQPEDGLVEVMLRDGYSVIPLDYAGSIRVGVSRDLQNPPRLNIDPISSENRMGFFYEGLEMVAWRTPNQFPSFIDGAGAPVADPKRYSLDSSRRVYVATYGTIASKEDQSSRVVDFPLVDGPPVLTLFPKGTNATTARVLFSTLDPRQDLRDPDAETRSLPKGEQTPPNGNLDDYLGGYGLLPLQDLDPEILGTNDFGTFTVPETGISMIDAQLLADQLTLPGTGFVGLPDEYDLQLMSVVAADDLVGNGYALVVIALVGVDLHIRIFDARGAVVLDKPESELISGQPLTDLKEWLSSVPFPSQGDLSPVEEQEVIGIAASLAGHRLPSIGAQTGTFRVESPDANPVLTTGFGGNINLDGTFPWLRDSADDAEGTFAANFPTGLRAAEGGPIQVSAARLNAHSIELVVPGLELINSHLQSTGLATTDPLTGATYQTDPVGKPLGYVRVVAPSDAVSLGSSTFDAAGDLIIRAHTTSISAGSFRSHEGDLTIRSQEVRVRDDAELAAAGTLWLSGFGDEAESDLFIGDPYSVNAMSPGATISVPRGGTGGSVRFDNFNTIALARSSISADRIRVKATGVFDPDPGDATGQMVVNQQLGTLGIGTINIAGDTANGANNADTYTSVGRAFVLNHDRRNYGNEWVYEFSVDQPVTITARRNITDFEHYSSLFLLDGLGTRSDGIKDDALGGLSHQTFVSSHNGFDYPPYTQPLRTLSPGTHYLSVETFLGFDSQVTTRTEEFDYDLILSAPPAPPSATDLGVFAVAGEPIYIDAYGSNPGFSSYPTLALWDELGNLEHKEFGQSGRLAKFDITSGLEAGTYYMSVSVNPTSVDYGFELKPGGQFLRVGDFVLRHPNGSENGFLDYDESLIYSFEVTPLPECSILDEVEMESTAFARIYVNHELKIRNQVRIQQGQLAALTLTVEEGATLELTGDEAGVFANVHNYGRPGFGTLILNGDLEDGSQKRPNFHARPHFGEE